MPLIYFSRSEHFVQLHVLCGLGTSEGMAGGVAKQARAVVLVMGFSAESGPL